MELTFETLVAELTRDANSAKPQDALRWCLNWFQQRLEGQVARPPAYRASLPEDHFADTSTQSNRLPTGNPTAEAVSPYSRFPPGYRPPLAKLRGPRPVGALKVPGNTLEDAEDLLAPPPPFNTGLTLNSGQHSTYQNTSPSSAPGRSSPRTTSMIFARRPPVNTGPTAFNDETTDPPSGFPGTAEQFDRARNPIMNEFIFRDLDEGQETWVLDAMRTMGIEADGIAIYQGDTGECFSIVESGHASHYTRPKPSPSWPPPQPTPTSLPSEESLQPNVIARPPGSSSAPLAWGPIANSFIENRLLYGVCKPFSATRKHWSVEPFPPQHSGSPLLRSPALRGCLRVRSQMTSLCLPEGFCPSTSRHRIGVIFWRCWLGWVGLGSKRPSKR